MKQFESIGRIAILIFLLYSYPAKYAFYAFIAFRIFDLLRLFFYSVRFERIIRNQEIFSFPKAADAHLKTMPYWSKVLATIGPLFVFAFVIIYLIDSTGILTRYVPSIDISGIDVHWFRRMSIAFLTTELLYFWLKLHYRHHRSFWYCTDKGVLDYEKKKEKYLWSRHDSFELDHKSSAVLLYQERKTIHRLHVRPSQWNASFPEIENFVSAHLKLKSR